MRSLLQYLLVIAIVLLQSLVFFPASADAQDPDAQLHVLL